MIDPDATPRCADFSADRLPGPQAMPSRIDDRVRIQARRSLSNEGNEPRRSERRHTGGRRHDAPAGNVVMLDDV